MGPHTYDILGILVGSSLGGDYTKRYGHGPLFLKYLNRVNLSFSPTALSAGPFDFQSMV
jgi:hypothetical protein